MRWIMLGGIVAVIGYDALGSLAARQFGFPLAALLPGTLLLYGAVAALAARRYGWHVGFFAALALGLIDLTLGWTVSWAIGPGRPPGGLTIGTVLGAAVTGLLAASLAGSLGAWLGVRRRVTDERPGFE
jgi:hypothetical protein